MKQKDLEINMRVEVSGEVKYGESVYRVSSEGTVVETGKVKSLINVDMVDGDRNVTVFVKNKYLFKM